MKIESKADALIDFIHDDRKNRKYSLNSYIKTRKRLEFLGLTDIELNRVLIYLDYHGHQNTMNHLSESQKKKIEKMGVCLSPVKSIS